jgi:uncharacterized protein Yka (UPF0111/DUF47 family)
MDSGPLKDPSVWELIATHWMEILTFLGLGSGSGILAKKLTDQKQDSKIEQQGQSIEELKITITKVRKELYGDINEIRKDVNDLKVNLSEIKHIEEKIDSIKEDMLAKFDQIYNQQEMVLNQFIQYLKDK